ncbi:hypothetical protein K1T71_008416 [Dendrolimus kikuchii]|uniref:Uncharacterized protein n=1 Tax=Dendrolimus kikuchii TaxID=765133 RepID=A0ACC1CYP2_9NEOP|nr:hypothetical protein K1T71_008416 [Dendrolimus kikuchii]
MIKCQNTEVLCTYIIVVYVGVYTASLPYQQQAKLSIRSVLESTIPVLKPLISPANNSRCEVLKSFLGLTYEQMQIKNASVHDVLEIDLITKDGNVKYNFSSVKKLNRLMHNASSIVILVHGFMGSSNGLMVHGIAPELMKKRGIKILALDGRKIINLEYFRSSTYAVFMGELLGEFLSQIIRDGQDPLKISIIGHSLGSHIAGVSGKRVQELTGKQLGRITGLDPAGPCFVMANLDGRLDKTDAQYVDVIHTNGGMLGLRDPIGHKDFYPNGGRSQPRCMLSICDHSRAWEYYAESVTSPKQFPARKCENWTMFKEGSCSKKSLAYMGMNSGPGEPGTYFLTTGPSSPFGLGAAGSE